MTEELGERLLLVTEQGGYLVSLLHDLLPLARAGKEHSAAFGSGEGYKRLHAQVLKKFPAGYPDEDVLRKAGTSPPGEEAWQACCRILPAIHEASKFVRKSIELLDVLSSEFLPETLATRLQPRVSHLVLQVVCNTAKVLLLLHSMDEARFVVGVYHLLSPGKTSPPVTDTESIVGTLTKYDKPIQRLQEELPFAASLVAGAVQGTRPLLSPKLPEAILEAIESRTSDPVVPELLWRGQAFVWVGFTLLVVPSALREAEAMAALRLVLLDSYTFPIHGNEVFHHHKEFKEALKRLKLDQRGPGKKLTSQTSELAVAEAAGRHREVRARGVAAANRLLGRCAAGSCKDAALAPALLLTASLLKDEILWTATHWQHKPTTKVFKYIVSDWQDTSVASAISAVEELTVTLQEQTPSIERYWTKYLMGAWAKAVQGAAGEFLAVISGTGGGADALPTLEDFIRCCGAGEWEEASTNWLRCCVRVCSKVHPFASAAHKGGGAAKLFTLARGLEGFSQFASGFRDAISNHAAPSRLACFRKWYADLFSKRLAMPSPQGCREAVQMLRAVRWFHLETHPWRPETDCDNAAEDAESLAEELLETGLVKLKELLAARGAYLQSLGTQTDGAQAAKAFLATGGEVDTPSSPNLPEPPGWESLHHNLPSILARHRVLSSAAELLALPQAVASCVDAGGSPFLSGLAPGLPSGRDLALTAHLSGTCPEEQASGHLAAASNALFGKDRPMYCEALSGFEARPQQLQPQQFLSCVPQVLSGVAKGVAAGVAGKREDTGALLEGLVQLGIVAHVCGQTLLPLLEEHLGSDKNDQVAPALAHAFTHPFWSRCGRFDPLRNGWKNNLHCAVAGARILLSHAHRTIDAYNEAAAYLCKHVAAYLLPKASSKPTSKEEQQTFFAQVLFLKRLVHCDPKLRPQVLTENFPHALLREIEIVSHDKEAEGDAKK